MSGTVSKPLTSGGGESKGVQQARSIAGDYAPASAKPIATSAGQGALACLQDRRLSDLENQSCLDAERFYHLIRKAKDCKQRIANRKPEIERLRKEMWG